MKKKTLLFFGIVLAFLAVDFASAPLRMFHFALASIVGYTTLFGFEIFVLYRCKTLRPFTILLASLLGFALLNLPGRFMQDTNASWPDFLIRLAAILLAYLYFTVRTRTPKVLIGILCCLILAGAYPITEKWVCYLNYGSLNGHTKKSVYIEEMAVKDVQGETTSYRFLPDKTYVLYFWTNRCGYCHRFFPDFIELNQQFGSETDVCFLAANPRDIPAEENFITLQSDIPCFYTTREFADTVGIRGYPTVIIIRNNRTVLLGNTSMTRDFLSE